MVLRARGPGGGTVVREAFTGVLWLSSGAGAQAVLQLLVLTILARLLTPTDFGLVSTAVIVINFTEIFSLLGLGPAIIQRSKLREIHLRTGFTFSLLSSASLALVVAALAPSIGGWFAMENLSPILQVLSWTFIIRGAGVVADCLLQRELRFKRLAAVKLGSYFLGYGLVGVGLAWLDFGFWALVYAHLTQSLSRTLALLYLQDHPKRPALKWKPLLQLMHFGSGSTGASFANYVASEGDKLIVSRGLGAQALGFYGRAAQLTSVPSTLLGKTVVAVLFPMMSRFQDDRQRLGIAFKRITAILAFTLIPASAVMWVVAPEIVAVLLGPQWNAVVLPFQILLARSYFMALGKVVSSLLRAEGSVHGLAWRKAIYALCILGACWVVFPYGLSSVAAAVVGASVVHLVLLLQLNLRITRMPFGTLIRIHAPAILFGAIILAVSSLAARFMRAEQAGAMIILAGVSAACAVPALLMYFLIPERLLGKEWIWWKRNLSGFLRHTREREEPKQEAGTPRLRPRTKPGNPVPEEDPGSLSSGEQD